MCIRDSMKDVMLERNSSGIEWLWRVDGKGGYVEDVPLWTAVIDQLIRYRQHRHLPSYPDPSEAYPLVARLGNEMPVSSSTIYLIVKDACTGAAELARSDGSPAASILEKASTHWLRHAAITNALSESKDIRYARSIGRHKRLSTTGLYLHNHNNDMREALQGLTVSWD